jgi:glyoxylase-like metal-dependent hydrolase (beta-lactamase superfamily II)
MSDWRGGAVTPRARCVLADNPGPMTLDGTNTWVLREPGARRSVVIDPGPQDEAHLRAVHEAAGDVAVVLLTHGHSDHAEGAGRFAELAGCPVRALDPVHRLGTEGLSDGDVVDVDGLELRVVGTAGHTADSLSFVLSADAALLSGDTVLGRGTSVVAHPDGSLDSYLESLRRLREIAERAEVTRVLPGHGPPLDDALAVVEHYLRHREDRLAQVQEALATGARTAADVVARVYADVDGRCGRPQRARYARSWPISAGAALEPARVEEHHGAGLEADPAAGGEVGERLVDGLP